MNKKHVLCFGDSNTWGYCAQTQGRYDDATRWTRQLSGLLGEEYLVVMMLGTNDCKQRFSATPDNIKDGLLRLVKKARVTEAWREEPRLLIVAPIIMDRRLYDTPHGAGMGEGSVEKSEQLPALFRGLALECGCAFLDSNPYVTPAPGDFMHFDPDSNRRFAQALAEKIRAIC